MGTSSPVTSYRKAGEGVAVYRNRISERRKLFPQGNILPPPMATEAIEEEG